MNEIKFKQKIDALKFNDNGLIPCVAQDHESKQVLMLAWGSRDTLFQSVSSGLATYWSRSRGEVWVKGKTSGNIQEIKKIYIRFLNEYFLKYIDHIFERLKLN